MKSYGNIVFLVLIAMVIFCQASFADPQGQETKTEDTVAVILDSLLTVIQKEKLMLSLRRSETLSL